MKREPTLKLDGVRPAWWPRQRRRAPRPPMPKHLRQHSDEFAEALYHEYELAGGIWLAGSALSFVLVERKKGNPPC